MTAKRIFFVSLWFICLLATKAEAQKFGYIDSEYITSKMPDFKKANATMDQFSEKWVKEISDKDAELEKLQKSYQVEEILLTDDMKRERQKAIAEKEKTIKELSNKVFAPDGMIFQKKKELMKPIMEDIYKAVEKVAVQQKLMFLFDKSSDMTMIYSDPRHDYTDFVIEALGLDKEEETAAVPAKKQ
jgi:outer membrane protein